MNMTKIRYTIKTAAEEEICFHLKECDDNFSPPLHERVDIEKYSKKIFEKAITFEAWADHLLIGLLAAYFNDHISHSGFITCVSVLKNFMGAGIASELLPRCIEYARQHHFIHITLEVSKDNNPAIGLYKKFNFIYDDMRDDSLFMKLAIEQSQ